jgi:uncharacterized protein (DUF2141 family)
MKKFILVLACIPVFYSVNATALNFDLGYDELSESVGVVLAGQKDVTNANLAQRSRQYIYNSNAGYQVFWNPISFPDTINETGSTFSSPTGLSLGANKKLLPSNPVYLQGYSNISTSCGSGVGRVVDSSASALPLPTVPWDYFVSSQLTDWQQSGNNSAFSKIQTALTTSTDGCVRYWYDRLLLTQKNLQTYIKTDSNGNNLQKIYLSDDALRPGLSSVTFPTFPPGYNISSSGYVPPGMPVSTESPQNYFISDNGLWNFCTMDGNGNYQGVIGTQPLSGYQSCSGSNSLTGAATAEANLHAFLAKLFNADEDGLFQEIESYLPDFLINGQQTAEMGAIENFYQYTIQNIGAYSQTVSVGVESSPAGAGTGLYCAQGERTPVDNCAYQYLLSYTPPGSSQPVNLVGSGNTADLISRFLKLHNPSNNPLGVNVAPFFMSTEFWNGDRYNDTQGSSFVSLNQFFSINSTAPPFLDVLYTDLSAALCPPDPNNNNIPLCLDGKHQLNNLWDADSFQSNTNNTYPFNTMNRADCSSYPANCSGKAELDQLKWIVKFTDWLSNTNNSSTYPIHSTGFGVALNDFNTSTETFVWGTLLLPGLTYNDGTFIQKLGALYLEQQTGPSPVPSGSFIVLSDNQSSYCASSITVISYNDCPTLSGASQTDSFGDGIGDACRVAAHDDYSASGFANVTFINTGSAAGKVWTGQQAAPYANLSAPYSTFSFGSYVYQASADFDGDGQVDLLFYNPSDGTTIVWPSTYSGGASYPGTSPGSNYTVGAVCDFNGDGKADVLWYSTSTGAITIWPGSPGTAANPYLNKSAAYYPGAQSSTLMPVGCGDFDGDGYKDMLWLNTVSPYGLSIWPGSSAGPLKSLQSYQGSFGNTAWAVSGVGDFNADGAADVLWFNASTRQTKMWPSAVKANATNLGAGDSGYAPSVVGDFNGDGFADIFWSNSSTLATKIWPGSASGPLKSSAINPGAYTTGYTPVP